MGVSLNDPATGEVISIFRTCSRHRCVGLWIAGLAGGKPRRRVGMLAARRHFVGVGSSADERVPRLRNVDPERVETWLADIPMQKSCNKRCCSAILV